MDGIMIVNCKLLVLELRFLAKKLLATSTNVAKQSQGEATPAFATKGLLSHMVVAHRAEPCIESRKTLRNPLHTANRPSGHPQRMSTTT